LQLFRSSKKTVETDRKKDRYRIIGLLGKGIYSDIFNCFDEQLNRIVALKMLRSEHVSNQTIVSKFINEAKLLGFLEHPGIMTLYDIFFDENATPGYTMKLVKGNNLRGEFGNKTRAQLLNTFIKLCEALASAHDYGVIHLDLNPENIMMGSYGEVVIIDWGNALLFNDKPYKEYLQLIREAPEPSSCNQPVFNDVISSYSSPEQIAMNVDALSPSSDIFSMGVILYEMMSGKVPFASPDRVLLEKQIQFGIVPSLHEYCSDIPHLLSQICAKMMAKDPFNRYHSFNSILTDLDRYQNSGQAFYKRVLYGGDVLFKEGEQGDFAFIILSGTLEVSRMKDGYKIVLAFLKREEIGGELALFTNEPRTATITALEETTICLLSRQSVENELLKLSPWIQNMIYGLAKRFIKLNDYLVN
jgi:serine/threonine protein kinase